jgi:hypothetical protein
MMKKFVLVSACFLMAILSNVCSQQTITDESHLFSIDIPSGWLHTATVNKWVSVFTFCDSLKQTDQLIVIYSKNGNNLKDAYKGNKKAQSELKNFKLIEEGDGQINGEPCKWMVYTFTSEGVLVNGKQYTLKKGGHGFTLQYILLSPQFEISKDVFEKVVSTFKLQ